MVTIVTTLPTELYEYVILVGFEPTTKDLESPVLTANTKESIRNISTNIEYHNYDKPLHSREHSFFLGGLNYYIDISPSLYNLKQ